MHCCISVKILQKCIKVYYNFQTKTHIDISASLVNKIKQKTLMSLGKRMGAISDS